MSDDNLSTGQVNALLNMMAMITLPGDGEVVDANTPGAFLSPVISVEAERPCAIPCKDGKSFSKVFHEAKFNGRCWLCGEMEIHGKETLITNWGAGWVSFQCFLKDAQQSTTGEMVEKQLFSTRFYELFSSGLEGVTRKRVNDFLKRQIGEDTRYIISNTGMQNAIRRALKNFDELKIFVNEIRGELL